MRSKNARHGAKKTEFTGKRWRCPSFLFETRRFFWLYGGGGRAPHAEDTPGCSVCFVLPLLVRLARWRPLDALSSKLRGKRALCRVHGSVGFAFLYWAGGKVAEHFASTKNKHALQRKRQEATKPQKPTSKEQQATNDTDNPDNTKNAKNAPPTTAPAGATGGVLCFVSFCTCVTWVTGVAAACADARVAAVRAAARDVARAPAPAPPPAPALRRRGERSDGKATAKRRRSDSEATAKRRAKRRFSLSN